MQERDMKIRFKRFILNFETYPKSAETFETGDYEW